MRNSGSSSYKFNKGKVKNCLYTYHSYLLPAGCPSQHTFLLTSYPCSVEGCPANSLFFLKCLVQEFVSLFRHGTSELSCPWLQVHHSLLVVYLSQEPMGNLHAFAVTEICCQQACRVLGQNCFTLGTIQNGSSWQNKKSVIFFLFPCLSRSSMEIGRCT